MKRPWLLPALVGIELTGAVILAALCALHIYYTVLNNQQARRVVNYNLNRQAFSALAQDSVAYGTLSNRAVLKALIESGLPLNIVTNPPAAVAPKTSR
ncbi:MAG TPA: hypothetical protein PLX89_13810 [Verrucomicrobiota bacterium]|nr:hypothetical protein [Verrucomicrobiales bacterium]HRI14068.1 hypothetical protein [Verrucomicrobiota bacterium]